MQRIILKRFSIWKIPDGVKNGKEECAYFDISCQNSNPKSTNSDRIYRLQNGISMKAPDLSALTLKKILHYVPGNRIFAFNRAFGHICKIFAMPFTCWASKFNFRKHRPLVQ
jgi:hypothetical protein